MKKAKDFILKHKKWILLLIIVLILIIIYTAIYFMLFSYNSYNYDTKVEYLDNNLKWIKVTTNDLCEMSEKARPKTYVLTGKVDKDNIYKNLINKKTNEEFTQITFEDGWYVIFTLDDNKLKSYNESSINAYKNMLNSIKGGDIVSISAEIDYLQCDQALKTKWITLRGSGINPIKVLK